jgi:hypothetical protein
MMSPLSIPMVSPPGFAIVPEDGAARITLRFRGIADMSSIEPLDSYLHAVHEEAKAKKVGAVVVDFRALEFMNSSCFKCFVEWLGTVQDMPADARYKVVFEANREMHWQRRSLNALRCFAMDVVTVSAA